MPQVFSTPSGYTVLSVVDNEALTMEPMETWGAPDFQTWMDRYPGCAVAPSMVAKLLVMKLFKERPLKKPEEDMMPAGLEPAGHFHNIHSHSGLSVCWFETC